MNREKELKKILNSNIGFIKESDDAKLLYNNHGIKLSKDELNSVMMMVLKQKIYEIGSNAYLNFYPKDFVYFLKDSDSFKATPNELILINETALQTYYKSNKYYSDAKKKLWEHIDYNRNRKTRLTLKDILDIYKKTFNNKVLIRINKLSEESVKTFLDEYNSNINFTGNVLNDLKFFIEKVDVVEDEFDEGKFNSYFRKGGGRS